MQGTKYQVSGIVKESYSRDFKQELCNGENRIVNEKEK